MKSSKTFVYKKNLFNLGTTITALFAALASSSTSTPEQFQLSLKVALCHTFFNITGILKF